MSGPVVVPTARGEKALSPSDGYVLPHEHILCDLRARWRGPGAGTDPDPRGLTVSSRHIDKIRDNPQGSVRANLVLSDWYLAAEELRAAARTGCQLVVDLTVEGIGPQPALVALAAETAGLHAVIGIGRYTATALDDTQRQESRSALVDRWNAQVEQGVQGCAVGVIGELGVGVEFPAVEQRTLAAAARVAVRTGLPVVVHLEPGAPHLHAAMRTLERGGVDPDRVVLSHLDWTIDPVALADVLDGGYRIAFDLFGRSSLRRPDSGPYTDTDGQRIAAITRLVDDGHADLLLLSHDICMRHCLTRYGGYGYAHLARTVFPALAKAIGPDALFQITRVNPLQMLATRRTTI